MARPEFQVTDELRELVAIAAGAGTPQDEIAAGIGCSTPTLRKHFEQELEEGACRRRLDMLREMYRSGMKGNVTAQRAYLATPAPRTIAPPADGEEKPAAVGPKGKKEQAQDAARTAAEGTSWDSILPKPGAGKTLQ